MDNFYTATVYEKGCEVVRLYMTLLGKEGFRKGMDLYIQRHDGAAVSCEDFYQAMADANNVDLQPLMTWYFQGGTPTLRVETSYDSAAQTFSLHCEQSLTPTPGCSDPKPTLIPIALGLLGADGKDMPLRTLSVDGAAAESLEVGGVFPTTRVLRLSKAKQTFVFGEVSEEPCPSILRDFSAPVRLESTSAHTAAHLTFLLAHDSDSFNRWEASQLLFKQAIQACYEDGMQGCPMTLSGDLVAALRALLSEEGVDQQLQAYCLQPPSLKEILSTMSDVDPLVLHGAHRFVRSEIASGLKAEPECNTAVLVSRLLSPDLNLYW